MDSAHRNRAKNGFKVKELNSIGRGFNSDPLLIITLPDSRVLRIMSRSFLLAFFLLAVPSIGPFMSGSPNAAICNSDTDSIEANLEMLAVIFPDLFDEGLVRRGHKGLIVGSATADTRKDFKFLSDNGIDLDILSNLDTLPNEAFDFVLDLNFKSIKSVNRHLKTNGIVITQMKNEPLVLLQQHPDYRIVYLRRFQTTIVGMRKASLKNSLASYRGDSKLCDMTRKARKEALKGLEDALLEPPRGPRRALSKPMNGPREIKFLPDLLGDSLEAYRRRMLISGDKDGGFEEWFYKNYPTRNVHFEMYQWDVETDGWGISSSRTTMAEEGMSDWLRSNVGREDFVVMKAEEQVVEELIKEKTICLIDELFLECKNHQWEEEEHKTKRAYWQCLALYGKLRDQGIAVHQWWS